MEKEKLAYDLMEWLNEFSPESCGGYYKTKFGILHLWWGKPSWSYEYIDVLELPNDLEMYLEV